MKCIMCDSKDLAQIRKKIKENNNICRNCILRLSYYDYTETNTQHINSKLTSENTRLEIQNEELRKLLKDLK